MVQKEVKKKTSIYATAAVLSAMVLISMVYVFGSTSPTLLPFDQFTVSGMKTFSSTDELKNYLNTNAPNNSPNIYWGGRAESFGSDSALAPQATECHWGIEGLFFN